MRPQRAVGNRTVKGTVYLGMLEGMLEVAMREVACHAARRAARRTAARCARCARCAPELWRWYAKDGGQQMSQYRAADESVCPVRRVVMVLEDLHCHAMHAHSATRTVGGHSGVHQGRRVDAVGVATSVTACCVWSGHCGH